METKPLRVGIIGSIGSTICTTTETLNVIKRDLNEGNIIMIGKNAFIAADAIIDNEFIDFKTTKAKSIDEIINEPKSIVLTNPRMELHKRIKEDLYCMNPKDTFHERYGTEQKKYRKQNNRKRTKFRR